MLIRDLHKAAELFMSSVATFTCVELMDYKQFVFYTVVTSIVTQNRKTIRKEVINSPDIIAVIREIPNIQTFANSFYNCEYRAFFEAFVDVADAVSKDIYLHKHTKYFTKEMRLVAYK